jgi:phosphate transport system substrate-binding protein
MRSFLPLLLLGSIPALYVPPAAPLQLHGSTTVEGALGVHRAELETLVGRKVEFNGTGSSVGLASLAAGDTTVAMISSPLEEVVTKLNARAPGTVKPETLRATLIGHSRVAFIVNPRNRVRALSTAQITDIFLGKIKNWREVGGVDAPIVTVALANGGPLIPDALLHGAPIVATARFVPNAAQIPGVVAQDPSAIGIISTAHVKGPTSLVQTDVDISLPLYLVTRGEPQGDEAKLIAAAQKILGRAN